MAILFLYRLAYFLLSPLLLIFMIIRLFKKKENPLRFNERVGLPFKKRPCGKLVWFHGASVGEGLSMLPLIEKMLQNDKSLTIMVTTGTTTSADLLKKRLPNRAFHQFIPIDGYYITRHFLRHWRPDLVLWFESDFWPNMLAGIYKNKTPLVLLNGRISDKSFEKWQKYPALIGKIQRYFTLSFGQTPTDAARLKALGAKNTVCVGNLKFSAVYPPFDGEELKKMHALIANRPTWCMASTHDNEEEMGADIHLALCQDFPDLLSIFVPRHPHRADSIEKMALAKGLIVARRSRQDTIMPNTDIYLADTIGEMGLLYQLSNYVFVGGSLIPFGGQNMLEPMRLHRTVFVGPYAFNFKDIVAQAVDQKALIKVENPAELVKHLSTFFTNPSKSEIIAKNAEKLATSEVQVLDRVYNILKNTFHV